MENGLAMMELALWQRLTASVVHRRHMWLSTTTTRAMTTGAEIFVSRSRVVEGIFPRLKRSLNMPHTHAMHMSNKIAHAVLWLWHLKKANMVRTSRQSHINKLMHDTN